MVAINVALLQISDIKSNAILDTVNFLLMNVSQLHCCTVEKISILSESLPIIIVELQHLLQIFDVVICVRNLHSTILYKAMATLYQHSLIENQILKEYIGNSDTFVIPELCSVLLEPNSDHKKSFPLIYSNNLFVLTREYVQETFVHVLKPYLEQYEMNRRLALSKLKCIANVNVLDFYRYMWELMYFEAKQRQKLANSLNLIEDSFRKFGADTIFVSFNGGKDCTVLLHLCLAVLHKLQPNNHVKLWCLFVQNDPDPFLEQERFIEECKTIFDLKLITRRANIKEALQDLLSSDEEHTKFEACFIGTRRTDPFSNDLQEFQLTDNDWPQILRIHPLLNWCYNDIWECLRYFNLPYCKLYDEGYTSIGGQRNTLKNPQLLRHDIVNDLDNYLPAYKLYIDAKERCGRL